MNTQEKYYHEQQELAKQKAKEKELERELSKVLFKESYLKLKNIIKEGKFK